MGNWSRARVVLAYARVACLVKFWTRLGRRRGRTFDEMRRRTASNNIVEDKYDTEIAVARRHGVSLAPPRMWRREFAFLHEGYRVSLKEYLWSERCLFCDNNNKSAGSCFLAKQRKTTRDAVAYERRLADIMQLWADPTVGRSRHPQEFEDGLVRTFPDPDLIRTALDCSRVPAQHMTPKLSILLFAPGFRNLCPARVILDAVEPRRPTEDPLRHAARQSRVRELCRRPDGPGVRWRAWWLIKETRREWQTLRCEETGCEARGCKKCRWVRRKAEVKFCRDLDAGVGNFLREQFEARAGVFSEVPFPFSKVEGAWTGERVRVERCVVQSHIMNKSLSKKMYRID